MGGNAAGLQQLQAAAGNQAMGRMMDSTSTASPDAAPGTDRTQQDATTEAQEEAAATTPQTGEQDAPVMEPSPGEEETTPAEEGQEETEPEEAATSPEAAPAEQAQQGTEAVEEAEEAPSAGEAVPAEGMAAIPPLTLPVAPPLPRPVFMAMFNAPRAIRPTELSAILGNDTPDREEVQVAVADVARRFARQREDIRQKHERTAAQSLRLIADVTRQYEPLRLEIPMLLGTADMLVETIFQLMLQRVNDSAVAATAAIEASHETATQQVRRAAAVARRAVRQNADTAKAQITTVIDGLVQGRLATISSVDSDISNSASYTDDQLHNWQISIPTTYPHQGSGREVARNESYRAAAPRIATAARNAIATRTDELSVGLGDAARQTRENVSNTISPPLRQRAELTRTVGLRNVRQTFRATLNQLDQQATAAKAAVNDMRQSAIGQLQIRRHVVRTQLQQEAQQTLTAAWQQSSTAITQVVASLEETLPRYPDAVRNLYDTLVNAARGGPEALQQAAASGIPSVAAAIETAYRAQLEQRRMILSGTQRGITQLREQLVVRMDTVRVDGIQALENAAQLSSEGVQTIATNIANGFATASEGVNQVAANWSAPLARVYSGFIAQVRRSLEAANPEFVSSLEEYTRPFRDWLMPYSTPQTTFADSLEASFVPVWDDLIRRRDDLAGAMDKWSVFGGIDEAAIVRPLRGLTEARGLGLQELWRDRYRVSLVLSLRAKFDSIFGLGDDYYAAISYLSGDPAAGARFELRASIGYINDDEARMESVMRALSPDQISDLGTLDQVLGSNVLDEVRGALDGTDQQVFDALRGQNYALADAIRMREELDRARQQDDEDAVNTILTEYSLGRRVDQYAYRPEAEDVSQDQLWQNVIDEFAGLSGVGTRSTEHDVNAQTVRDYVLRDVEVIRSAGEAGTYTETLRVEGRQRDLAEAIIVTGGQSIRTRATRLLVETERSGGPNILNLDTALVDERLNRNYGGPNITPAQRQAAREQALQDREQVLRQYHAQRHNLRAEDVTLESARDSLILELAERTDAGSERDLAEALVRDEYPSPATVAIAMEYAQEGVGTEEDVIWRFLERMDRDEIAEMRSLYDVGGHDLYADLGVFGHGGFFTELSGDDRLRAERAMLGQPRNDREKAEVAAFAMHQQRAETGLIGEWWAEGSYSERALAYEEQRLRELIGTDITFGPDGVPQPRDPEAFARSFDDNGRFTGNEADFAATVLGARLASENYAAKVDQFSQAVTTAIAIVGVIVAGVVTVLTGGAASPLLLAAIAGVTGLTAMGAQALIRGGRYGWEQAAVDLGMTAVDALTAGVGQGLSLASRGGAAGLRAGLGLATEAGERGVGLLTQMSIGNARQLAVRTVNPTTRLLGNMGRITGSEFADKLLIGGTTSALGSLGRTALDENTYTRGGGHAIDHLFASLFQGMASGLVTAGITNSFDLVSSRLAQMGNSTGVFQRGLYQASTNALGAFGSRYVELGLSAARGDYRGDAGDMFVASLESAVQSGFQSGLEGGLSALGQRDYNRFARPYDEQLQANQLRRQMADAFGNPQAMEEVLAAINKAPSGVRVMLFVPMESVAAPRLPVDIETPRAAVPPTTGVEAMVPRPAGAQFEPDGTPSPSLIPTERALVLDAEGNRIPAAAALPPDLRNRIPIVRDPALTGDAVHVQRSPQIHIRVGPDARAADIADHTVTLRGMQRARGLIGLVRRAYDAVVGNPPPHTVAGEAYQELEKLPAIIERREEQMRLATDPAEQQRLQSELDNLYAQYRRHAEAAMSGDVSEGRGYVAMEDTTTQLRRLYGGQEVAVVRQIETDLARLFPDITNQEVVLTDVINDTETAYAAQVNLATHLHRFAVQLDSPLGQNHDFQQVAARILGGLTSRDAETRQGATRLVRYLSDNHGQFISGRKSATDLNMLLDTFGIKELNRIVALHEDMKPTAVLEPLSVLTRNLDVTDEANQELSLRLIELGERATSQDVNDLLGRRNLIRGEILPEQVRNLIGYVQDLGIQNPIGELARQIRRIRLQDPEATITAQRIRESINIDRSIAELVGQREFNSRAVYEALHMTEGVRTNFGSNSEAYEYFRNKAKASAEMVDQSFQANPLIEVLAGSATTATDSDMLTRWRALHDFIMELDITVNGEPFTYAHRRSMLGHMWEDVYLRTMMNSLGSPDVFRGGTLWSSHIRIHGANFDRVLVKQTGNEIVVEIADAKLSNVGYTDAQRRVVPMLQDLQNQTLENGFTLVQLRALLRDGTGSGTGISYLLNQLEGKFPETARFKVRMLPPVESLE
jgi:hypothetical protein